MRGIDDDLHEDNDGAADPQHRPQQEPHPVPTRHFNPAGRCTGCTASLLNRLFTGWHRAPRHG
eukprot:7800474-Prorocentrum_lima.AAC.1